MRTTHLFASRVALGLAATLIFVAAPAVAEEKHLVTEGFTAMGTEIRLSVFTTDDEGARRAITLAFDELRRIEALMTTWRPDSEVSRINANAGKQAVKISRETMEVLRAAEDSSRASGGVFDVTFYAMKGLWKFDEDLEKKLPDPDELKRRLPLINYRDLVLDAKKSTAFLRREGMAINLGGIAKGYAVDRAAAILKRAGFHDGLVQAGGDLLCLGSKGGKPWSAGIRDPRSAPTDPFAVLQLTDHAFSTAGDYERFFFLDGKRYHHIIDPRTGYPATAARSVTIYAKTALLADALDDAVLILGPKAGMELLKKYPDVGAVIVDKDNQVFITENLKTRVVVRHPPTDAP